MYPFFLTYPSSKMYFIRRPYTRASLALFKSLMLQEVLLEPILASSFILIGSPCHPERSEGSQPTVNVTPFK